VLCLDPIRCFIPANAKTAHIKDQFIGPNRLLPVSHMLTHVREVNGIVSYFYYTSSKEEK
jgi:hypothetical protein